MPPIVVRHPSWPRGVVTAPCVARLWIVMLMILHTFRVCRITAKRSSCLPPYTGKNELALGAYLHLLVLCCAMFVSCTVLCKQRVVLCSRATDGWLHACTAVLWLQRSLCSQLCPRDGVHRLFQLLLVHSSHLWQHQSGLEHQCCCCCYYCIRCKVQ